jgi:hypothetical protein
MTSNKKSNFECMKGMNFTILYGEKYVSEGIGEAEMVHIWDHWVFVEVGGMNCHHNCLPLRGRSRSKSSTKMLV